MVSAIGAGADDFLKKPVRTAELLARLMAGSRILELEARLHDLADHDGLTGLLLRRPFGRFSEQEWQRSIRDRLSLSAVMVDIDHFKQVNDIHGHPAGDAVIRQVANLMCESAGNSDIICRYGGEEFCILLPETDEASAMAWAERLRRRVADARISVGGTDLQVTISLGVAEMLAEMEDKDELLGLADQCLRPEWPIVRAAAYFLQYCVPNTTSPRAFSANPTCRMP
ncbi:MAG TPA: diguanylate cyclase [Pirellulaceae bacterium]|nr:diguanylate cyclase [Pirellulaceae bacterium]